MPTAPDTTLVLDETPCTVVCVSLHPRLSTTELDGYSYRFPIGVGAEFESVGWDEYTAEFHHEFQTEYRFQNTDTAETWFHQAPFWETRTENSKNPFVKLAWAAGTATCLPRTPTPVSETAGVVGFRDPFEGTIRVFAGESDVNAVCLGSRIFCPQVSVIVVDPDGTHYRIQYDSSGLNPVTVFDSLDVTETESGSDTEFTSSWSESSVPAPESERVLEVIRDETDNDPAYPGAFEEQYLPAWMMSR